MFHSYEPAHGKVAIKYVVGNIALSDAGFFVAMMTRVISSSLFISISYYFSGATIAKFVPVAIPALILGTFFWATLFLISHFEWREAATRRAP